METRRNNATGEISVTAKNFEVVVSEDAVRIQVGDTLAHEWKFEPVANLAGQVDRSDRPSPRSRPADRKRGAR
jgi:hypothetical protein